MLDGDDDRGGGTGIAPCNGGGGGNVTLAVGEMALVGVGGYSALVGVVV